MGDEFQAQVAEYLEGFGKASDSLLLEMEERARAKEDPIPIIPLATARLLTFLVATIRAERILEIGTAIGYSTIWLARAAQPHGGQITTIEISERLAGEAQKNIERAGLLGAVTILIGDAERIVPRLTGSFDLIFQDAEKSLYPRLLGDCLRLLRKGGLLVADNALFPVIKIGEARAEAIHRYNEMIFARHDLESLLLPVGDGVAISLKR
ncbi:MAG: O-methyltransferase [Anaerolineae bacterium]